MQTTAEPDVPAQTDRRAALVSMIYGLWAAIAAALSAPALAYLFFPPKPQKQGEWIEAGDISRLEPGVPLEVVFRRNRIDGWKVTSEKSTAWVVRRPDRQVVVFGPQCTHLGCAYHWDESKREFLCPCHSSIFSIEGKVIAGPAPRPLDRYDVRVQNNKLLLGRLRESEPSA